MTEKNPHARLGLTPNASAEEVEKAHSELVTFLEGAPAGARRWAKGEIAAADAAYATLSDPARVRAARRGSPLKRAVVAIVALAVAAVVVVGVYDIGGGQGKAKPQGAEATGAPALSPSAEARVSQLMRKLKAKPKDVATLIELGNIFFAARDFNNAGGWMKQALAIEPKNVKARLALGASEFNINDVADARRDWLRVIAADRKNVEAYYDLGFLYVSRNPPDLADAKKMWGKVVALDPNSPVAKTVATHLKGLEKAEAQTGGRG